MVEIDLLHACDYAALIAPTGTEKSFKHQAGLKTHETNCAFFHVQVSLSLAKIDHLKHATDTIK
jgi:hypothetical protein